MIPFTGSYTAEQTIFLLKPVDLPSTPVQEKERLIQSGQRHYSEMITRESAPDSAYLALFEDLTRLYKTRLAGEINTLAAAIAAGCPGEITLVSLARAGTPVGALLKRGLEILGRSAKHYSMSIILDRGIDEAALSFLIDQEGCEPSSLRFIDGWTAKGSIGRELRTAIDRWNSRRRTGLLDSALHVVMDLGGTAEVAATLDDYAIPCGILNATVSGLISRTVLLPGRMPEDFHGCLFHHELAAYDRTQWFFGEVASELERSSAGVPVDTEALRHRQVETSRFLAKTQARYEIEAVNRIKPGVAEATRAVLRRYPDRLVVRDPMSLDVAHLLVLAQERGLPIDVDPKMPYNAMTLIRRSHA